MSETLTLPAPREDHHDWESDLAELGFSKLMDGDLGESELIGKSSEHDQA